MAIAGNLQDLSLTTLIQSLIQERRAVRIAIKSGNVDAWLYLNAGVVEHAMISQDNNPLFEGSEAVYELLSWKLGQFRIEKNRPSPGKNLDESWDHLQMEGLRQIDERRAKNAQTQEAESLDDMLLGLSKEDAAAIRALTAQDSKENYNMANIKQTLQAIMEMEGAVAAALVDWKSGLTLGTVGTGLNIELAAAGNTNVVRAKMAVMKDLGLKGGIEDILITLTEQYHLIRILESNSDLFLYVALNRSSGNLGLARHRLTGLEHDLTV
jgi:hypothetical protein